MQDSYWLKQAEELVWSAVGKTAPNPAVAAIIVRNQEIIAQGVHLKAGDLHAEQIALLACADASGATMYVTLEPCNHQGKTPACSKAIYNSGIARVVYGCKDLNPAVAGSGAKFLQSKGIECLNLNSDFCLALYDAFFLWAQNNMASMTLKIAFDQLMNTAADDGSMLKITSAKMNLATANWRAFHDAILTTDRTILHDDPRMNARLNTGVESKKLLILAQKDVFDIRQNIFTTCDEIYIFIPHGLELNAEVASRVTAVHYSGEYAAWQDILEAAAGFGIHRIWAEVGSNTAKHIIDNKIARDIMLLQGVSSYPESRHNLRDLKLPSYSFRNLYDNGEGEKIFYIGDSSFPDFYITKERCV